MQPTAVTVYVVVTAGLAVTEVPIVPDKPAAGDHVKLLAPLAEAVSLILPEGQMFAGLGLTVTGQFWANVSLLNIAANRKKNKEMNLNKLLSYGFVCNLRNKSLHTADLILTVGL